MRLLDLLSPRDLQKVAKLQVLAREVVEGFCGGRHRSPHKGFSVEFREHRPYVRGDELRNIDWKVFGKSDRLFIREYEEETNLRCTLLVDRSGSMDYAGGRSGGRTKGEYAAQAAASLAYLMLAQQDAVGLVTFDSEPREHVPPRSRPSHLRAILAALTRETPRRETDLGAVFHRLVPKLQRRGLLVILSDAMGDIDSIGRALAHFRAAHHELIFFHVLDPDEIDFPFDGRIRFRDLERPGHEQTIDALALREAYRERFTEYVRGLQGVCRRHHVDLVRLTTDRPLAESLHQYLSLRRRIR